MLAFRRRFARWWVLRVPRTPGSSRPRVPLGLILGRRIAWAEDTVVTDDGRPGLPRVLDRLALVVADGAALEAVGRHPIALVGVVRLRIEISSWRAPIRGWIGRLGPVRGLIRSEVRVANPGGGRVRIDVELAAERPLREVMAAVDAILRPGSPLPVTHTSSVGTHGRLPAWLPVGADAAARFVMPPGTPLVPGIDPVNGWARTPEDPPPNRPAVDAELVMPGAVPGGLGLVAAPVVRVTEAGIAAPDDAATPTEGARVLVDVRGEYHSWVTPGGDARHLVVEVRGPTASPTWRPRLRSDAGDPSDGVGTPMGPWLGLDVSPARAEALEEQRWWSVAWDVDATVDPALAAGIVVRAALESPVVDGRGVPGAVRACLSPELAAIVERPLPPTDEPLTWERRSVEQRRAAVRGHATSLVMEDALRPGALATSAPPLVSALLVTRRPGLAASVLLAMEGQTYPRLEVVLTLHGVPADETLRRAIAASPLPVEVVDMPAEANLGEALAVATARARGSLVTKVDDDDLYGPEHVWDLVVGRALSGATVVGKPAQFVLLDQMGITVRRERPLSDTFGRIVAGGTIMVARGELEALGGWRPVPSGVDRALLDRVLHAGGTIFQMWPFGFVYRRHGMGHTWDVSDAYFLRGAVARWDGVPDLPEFSQPPPLA